MNLLHLMENNAASHCKICDEPSWSWNEGDAYVMDADSYDQENFAKNNNLICCSEPIYDCKRYGRCHDLTAVGCNSQCRSYQQPDKEKQDGGM